MKKILKFIKWFYPGLKIKRWISLLLIGLIFILVASPYLSKDKHFALRMVSFLVIAVGIGAFSVGTVSLIKSFFEVIYPNKDKELIDIIYEKRYLSKGPKIVAFGGGTGLSTILEGLKEYTSNVAGIVTVADEGGSSGRLREEFGILPPGDIRHCLVSLAEAPQLMRDLFQYRFQEGNGIKGHSFGNLFITAMTQVAGSFQDAVEESSKVLAIRGKVVPSSLENIRLKAEYLDGSMKEGEDKIPKEKKPIKRIYLVPEDAKPNPLALEVIKEADIILLGPGSLFTSILPNLLLKEIGETICRRKDIPKIYICNVMTQYGETDGFTAYEHVEALISHIGKDIMNCCLVNCGKLEHDLLLKYSQEESFPVILDIRRIKERNIFVFENDVVSKTNHLRHDPYKTAKQIINIYNYFKKTCKTLRKKSL